jgi:hypothetical protein
MPPTCASPWTRRALFGAAGVELSEAALAALVRGGPRRLGRRAGWPRCRWPGTDPGGSRQVLRRADGSDFAGRVLDHPERPVRRVCCCALGVRADWQRSSPICCPAGRAGSRSCGILRRQVRSWSRWIPAGHSSVPPVFADRFPQLGAGGLSREAAALLARPPMVPHTDIGGSVRHAQAAGLGPGRPPAVQPLPRPCPGRAARYRARAPVGSRPKWPPRIPNWPC